MVEGGGAFACGGAVRPLGGGGRGGPGFLEGGRAEGEVWGGGGGEVGGGVPGGAAAEGGVDEVELVGEGEEVGGPALLGGRVGVVVVVGWGGEEVLGGGLVGVNQGWPRRCDLQCLCDCFQG